MGANFPSIIFANGYTDESLMGGGAIKGANCTITSITPVTIGELTGNKITFEWTLNDGSKRQNSFNVMDGKDGEDGADGVSVVGFTLIDESHFVWDFSDSSQSSPIEIPSGNVDISTEAGNALVKKPDGLYVGATGVEISQESDNAIENKADGLYVKKTSDVQIKKKAEIVDEEPVYDASGEKPVIIYKQNGETKTTEDIDMWFYYTEDGKTTQVVWINGVQLKLAVDNAADFSDLISKTKDIVSTYTGEETDKTKIPNLAALDALKGIIDNSLSGKVNTVDIVNTLASDATNKPLSAAQGKALNESKLNNKTDVINAGKALVVDDEGNIIYGEAGVQVSRATGNRIESKTDGIFVEAEIHEVTEAEYEAMSEAERDGKNWLIKDKTPQTVDKYLINDTNVSEQKAYSSKKVNDELAKKADKDKVLDFARTTAVINADDLPDGFVIAKALTNAPANTTNTVSYKTITYSDNKLDYRVQEATINSSSRKFIRHKTEGVWSDWAEFAAKNDINAMFKTVTVQTADTFNSVINAYSGSSTVALSPVIPEGYTILAIKKTLVNNSKCIPANISNTGSQIQFQLINTTNVQQTVSSISMILILAKSALFG